MQSLSDVQRESAVSFQDEEAQNWLTSPDVGPAEVGAAWEAAGRLTALYDEALLHTMRTVRPAEGQTPRELRDQCC